MIDCTGVQSSLSLLLAQSICGRPCHCRNASWLGLITSFPPAGLVQRSCHTAHLDHCEAQHSDCEASSQINWTRGDPDRPELGIYLYICLGGRQVFRGYR